MMEFEDTELAFKDKSPAEIKRAYFLFRLVGNPFLVKAGALLVRTAIRLRLPVRWVLKPTVFTHFCGGEDIQGCESTVRRLDRSGIYSILDYSAEGKETDADFEYTRDQILATIDKAVHDKAVPYAVFKPTGLVRFSLLEKIQAGSLLDDYELIENELFHARIQSICEHSLKTGIPVMIDAEESWIQDVVDKLTESLMLRFNKGRPLIYNTLQMYRHDRLGYLHKFVKNAHEQGVIPAFKLVRGAYMEKERERARVMGYASPVYPDKPSTDHAFDEAVRFCLEHSDTMAVCIGTHNEKSCAAAADLILSASIDRDHPHISFAQLLGMSDHISYKLAAERFNVCKYVPYGPVNTVVPYLIRRAEENTSVAGQTSRELYLVKKELERRYGR